MFAGRPLPNEKEKTVKGILAILILTATAFSPENVQAKKISSVTDTLEFTGYMQYPTYQEYGNHPAMTLWSHPIKKKGSNEGTLLTFDKAAIDSLGSIADLQHQETTITGIFQKYRNGVFFCIEVLSIGKSDMAVKKELAREAEELLANTTLSVEGYLEHQQDTLLVYTSPTGEGFNEPEVIKFDRHTLFIGLPKERLKILGDTKVSVKVSWRPKDLRTGEDLADYVANYINVRKIDKK